MTNYAFSKIWIIVILVVIVGAGFFAWQYFGGVGLEEEVEEQEEEIEDQINQYYEMREATRESHMSHIGTAVHMAVVDCEEGEEKYCANVKAVVETCRAGEEDWRFKAGGYCTVDDYLVPEDPQTGNAYYIDNDGDHSVKVWADAPESGWYCNWQDGACIGTPKAF